MRRGNAYDSRESLEACEHKSLNRQLGVLVSEPFIHYGRDAIMVDIEWEGITVNTASFGKPVAAEEWSQHALHSTRRVINQLGDVIAELIEHRKRLTNHVEALSTHEAPMSLHIKPRSKAYKEAEAAVTEADVAIQQKLDKLIL